MFLTLRKPTQYVGEHFAVCGSAAWASYCSVFGVGTEVSWQAGHQAGGEDGLKTHRKTGVVCLIASKQSFLSGHHCSQWKSSCSPVHSSPHGPGEWTRS